MNSWESSALQYHYPEALEPEEDIPSETDSQISTSPELQQSSFTRQVWQHSDAHDPCGIIYPGLYSASGLDIMNLLMLVVTRPNPQIHLGPIDGNCAMLVCDMDAPDMPVVYANDSFCELTGYTVREVMGKNCRFLQQPPGILYSAGANMDGPVKLMHDAVRNKDEIQVDVINFKKDGTQFVNALSLVPISWGTQGRIKKYCVGFSADRDSF